MKRIVPVLCMIQDQSLSSSQIMQLESTMIALYRQHFGPVYRVLPLWLTILAGQAFVAGQPSRASSVMFPVPDQLPASARHHFMRELSAMWMEISRCDQDQLILVAPDQTEGINLIRANSQRFRSSMRVVAQGSLVLRLLSSRLRSGYAAATINFLF